MIYTVAIGYRYRQLASMLVDSIFAIGHWRGKVVVLTDTCEFHASGAHVVGIMGEGQIGSDSLMARGHKVDVMDHEDLALYDYILLLDADVLVNSLRVTSLVSAASASRKICVMQDIWSVRKVHRVTGKYVLTEHEKLKWGDVAINSGVVGFPGGRFAVEFLTKWKRLNAQQAAASFSDQASLYPLLLREYNGRWQYIGDTIHGRELRRYIETLVDFTGGSKDTLMRRYFVEILGRKPPTSCGGNQQAENI